MGLRRPFSPVRQTFDNQSPVWRSSWNFDFDSANRIQSEQGVGKPLSFGGMLGRRTDFQQPLDQ
jgi:hypothetical protein